MPSFSKGRVMDYSEITVVLPTLNERDTIGKLIHLITEEYKGIKIIVADDNSKDGTIGIVQRISSSNKNVRLLERAGKKRGLTASVIDGILASKTKYVVVMDADMQHPYQAIKEIKKKFEEGYDVVVVYRSVITNWPKYRMLISKITILIGYAILALRRRPRCADIFSGYFGVKRDLFVKVYSANKHRFVGEGYKVLFDFLKCLGKETKIAEVPSPFYPRKFGSSKAGIKQGIALFKSFFS
jgi:dolichol-phosphate mannosyltransferase